VARVFITGSSDGLGRMAARVLIEQGHEVVVHGRNDGRTRDALEAPGARAAVTGDLSTIAGARTVADQVNKLGRFNAVIHNAGVGYRETRRVETEPGVPSIFAVNVLAAYILTALIDRPGRLVYVSSGTHHGMRPRMDDCFGTKFLLYSHQRQSS
jgi:NAD(P)-dependent dehydrogenase (short-subunit alcohol dehydrogenase family)